MRITYEEAARTFERFALQGQLNGLSCISTPRTLSDKPVCCRVNVEFLGNTLVLELIQHRWMFWTIELSVIEQSERNLIRVWRYATNYDISQGLCHDCGGSHIGLNCPSPPVQNWLTPDTMHREIWRYIVQLCPQLLAAPLIDVSAYRLDWPSRWQ